MTMNALEAARAYGAMARQATQETGGQGNNATSGVDFGSMVTDAVTNTEATLRSAEALTQAAAHGQAELVDVVTAVAAAEVTMETVVAVRDEVIKAYQEIMRMPI